MNKHLDIIWTSTAELASTLGDTAARVLPPAPPASMLNFEKPAPLRPSHGERILIAYHATAIHVDEHQFLQPIVKDVLRMRQQVHFEVFAPSKAAHLWQGIERVIVRQQMTWQDYLREASTRQIDIMLVPLTPSAINRSRSSTKRIDVARVHAAGIYSASAAYDYSSQEGEIQLPYLSDRWKEAILELIDDPDARNSAKLATQSIVRRMAADADHGLSLSLDAVPFRDRAAALAVGDTNLRHRELRSAADISGTFTSSAPSER